MFKHILQIIPRLDPAQLAKMELTLNRRFAKVAKKFGKGLMGAIGGGGLLGVALSFIDKLLNPLKEMNEALDRTLKMGGDSVSNAEQFNSTPGRLLKLQAMAGAKGLDADSLDMLIQKFQVAVAEAVNDPTKQTSVRQFTGFTDSVEGFFQYLQGLQKLSKEDQILAQQEVFGEKQILKVADFLNSFKELPKFIENMKLYSAQAYTDAALTIDKYADMKDMNDSRRILNDLIPKSQILNEGIIRRRNTQDQRELNQENDKLNRYKTYDQMAKMSSEILNSLEKGTVELIKQGIDIANISNQIDKFSMSRFIRGIIFPGAGGD